MKRVQFDERLHIVHGRLTYETVAHITWTRDLGQSVAMDLCTLRLEMRPRKAHGPSVHDSGLSIIDRDIH